jgi:predicted HD superfamily hydrolase involved in NAD metabolism
MSKITLPPQLQSRLFLLPKSLQAHVQRIQVVARKLATAHGINADQAELAAAAHDVARHLPPRRLLEEAQRLGIPINTVEAHAPVLLHGPVGAAWLRGDGSVTDPEVLEAVYWHTTAHPDLAPVGQVLFLADKLDPAKANIYPFQDEVRQAAFRDLGSGMLVFMDGALRRHVDRGDTVHPVSNEVRNALILALAC